MKIQFEATTIVPSWELVAGLYERIEAPSKHTPLSVSVGFFGGLFMTEIERFGMAETQNKGKTWRKNDNRFILKNSLTENPERI